MASAKEVARVFEHLSLQDRGEPIENTRLNKLLYFAQGHALAELGHELFSNQIDAWTHGPVVAVVYKGFDKIVQNAEMKGASDIDLPSESIDIIMDVWNHYHKYTASELVKMTHERGTPWSETYKPLAKNVHIPVELIKQFFSKSENRLNRDPLINNKQPVPDVLPAEEYDPEEDAIWEGLLDDAP